MSALHMQVQFELTQAGADVARAATSCARIQHRVTNLAARCDLSSGELSSAMARVSVNPALLDAMRRLYQRQLQAAQGSRRELALAQQGEQERRVALAKLRDRVRSLERALGADRRKRQLAQQAIEDALADDRWLQHTWRKPA